jgi:hypothetical protein
VKLRLTIALAAVAAGLGAVGCGGDDESGAETTPSISIPAVTVPTAPTTTAPSGGVAPETTTGSGSGRGNYDPAQPDTPENDVPPPPGSPQEAFEQMCEQNPAACG